MASSLALAFASTACYVHVPVDPATLRAGEDVRLLVSYGAPQGSSALPAARRGQTLEGGFVSATDDSVAISVWTGREFRGTPFETVRETLTVPRQDVVLVERREFSKWRTGLIAIGAVAGFVVLADRIGLSQDPNPPGDPNGPPLPPNDFYRE